VRLPAASLLSENRPRSGGVLVAVCLLAACGDASPSGPFKAQVTHYDYAFDIETRAGHAELTMTVLDGGDRVTLPLRAQLVGTPTIDGEAVNATVEGESVRFCGVGYERGSTIVVGADVVVPLATIGPSQVGYSVTRDSAQNDFHYMVSWVGGCDRLRRAIPSPGNLRRISSRCITRRRTMRGARARSPR
jgi:aminopeptidase N